MNIKKYLIVGAITLSTISMVGCKGIHSHEEQGRDVVGNIVITADCGDGSYIGYDKFSGYEYFVSTTSYGSMVIGGNVLTADGLPKRHEGYQK